MVSSIVLFDYVRYNFLLFEQSNLLQLFQQQQVAVRAVIDDEVGKLAALLRLLHLHACHDLCFCRRVALHGPSEADVFGRVNEEDVVNVFVESALVEDGALQRDYRLRLLFRPG